MKFQHRSISFSPDKFLLIDQTHYYTPTDNILPLASIQKWVSVKTGTSEKQNKIGWGYGV